MAIKILRSEQTAPRDQRYKWAYLFGAVCPERACANTKAMAAHLNEIGRAVAPGAHAVMVMDGAGYHEKAIADLPANISLLTLPAYAPELNPVENVWQFLRQNHLANRVFEDYDAILDACCQAWQSFLSKPDNIASITQREWAKRVTH